MTKLDRDNYDRNNQLLPDKYSDAISALRGFANSKINAELFFQQALIGDYLHIVKMLMIFLE